MNEYEVKTEKGIEYVYAERFNLFPETYGRQQMAQFYRGKYIVHTSHYVISVTLVEEI